MRIDNIKNIEKNLLKAVSTGIHNANVIKDIIFFLKNIGDSPTLTNYLLEFYISSGKITHCQNIKIVVSVIIPCYNYSKYLRDAVTSALRQTYQSFEIIIVNDGSTDNSHEVAIKILTDFPNFHISYINQPNSGIVQPRNRGVAAARGKYILPLDADDMIAPQFLEKTLNLLESRPDFGFVSSKALFFGDKNQIWPREDFNPINLLITNQQGNTTLYRKEMWEDVGGYSESMVHGYMDWEFWIKCVKHGWIGEQIDEPLYLYRRKSDSVVMKAKNRDVNIKTQIMKLHPEIYNISKIDPSDPELHRKNWIPPSLLKTDIKIPRKVSSEVGSRQRNQAHSCKKDQLKTLFVCHNFPPYNTAGAQLFALNLAKELKTLGHDVSFFYPVDISKRGPGEDKTPYTVVSTEYEGLKVHQINVMDGSTDLFENPQYTFANESVEQQFEELLRREQFDLVHFHLLYRLSARLPLIAKSNNISTAATLHDYWLLCAMGHLIDTKGRECSGPESPEKCARCLGGFQADPAKEVVDFFRLRQQVNLAGYEALDRKYSPSKHLADVHARYGFSRPAVLALGGPAVQAPSISSTQSDRILLGYIGQIVYRKGLDLLVKAVNGLDATLRDKCELHIHGTVHQPQFFDAVMETVKDNPGVKFFGPYTQDDLGSVLSSFDVTVIPSRQENYPLTVLESLSAKVPVIASDVGGVREMFQDKVEGFLFPREDTTRLTNILRMLLAQPDLLATMRTKIRPVKTMRRNAEEYARVYEEMVKL